MMPNELKALRCFPGENATPSTLFIWAALHFPARTTLSCSFSGIGGLLLSHIIYSYALDIPILFIDTEFLFPDTYALRQLWAEKYNLNILDFRPELSPVQQTQVYGDLLWERNPNLCCALRKVQPMQQALANYKIWITALRRDQSPTRNTVEVLEHRKLTTGQHIIKLNPLAHWTKQQVWAYITLHRLPYNPLLDNGYASIGCLQCTQPCTNGTNERAGRWVGHTKTECGLHT